MCILCGVVFVWEGAGGGGGEWLLLHYLDFLNHCSDNVYSVILFVVVVCMFFFIYLLNTFFSYSLYLTVPFQ